MEAMLWPGAAARAVTPSGALLRPSPRTGTARRGYTCPPMGMDRAGVTFASLMALGPDLAVTTARQAEELGYSSFWTAETTGPEAFSVLAAAGAAAPGLDLGTGVLALQLRTPMVVAMAGATLQALHPDRDILLGVGISSPVVTERWHGVPYGDRPLARVREYVTLLRACLSGEKVDFAGDFYQVKGFRLGVRLGERRPKIVVGALNPRMLALAGELADGVLLNYLPASHVPWSVEQVRSGRRRHVYAYVHAGVCERDEGVEHGPARPVLVRGRRQLRPQLRAGRLRRRGRRDPRPLRRGRPGRRGGRRQRPHGRRHRRDGRRRHRARHDAGLRRRRRRRAGADAAALGQRTGGPRPRPRSARPSGRLTGGRRGARPIAGCAVLRCAAWSFGTASAS